MEDHSCLLPKNIRDSSCMWCRCSTLIMCCSQYLSHASSCFFEMSKKKFWCMNTSASANWTALFVLRGDVIVRSSSSRTPFWITVPHLVLTLLCCLIGICCAWSEMPRTRKLFGLPLRTHFWLRSSSIIEGNSIGVENDRDVIRMQMCLTKVDSKIWIPGATNEKLFRQENFGPFIVWTWRVDKSHVGLPS